MNMVINLHAAKHLFMHKKLTKSIKMCLFEDKIFHMSVLKADFDLNIKVNPSYSFLFESINYHLSIQ